MAGVLAAVSPLVDLLGDADDPIGLAEALHASAASKDLTGLRRRFAAAVDDVEFIDDVLRSAEILTVGGTLTAAAPLRLAQACAVLADRMARPAVTWTPVVTVPAALQVAIAAGRYTHTAAALRQVAAAARCRLLIASPFLDTRAVEVLTAPIAQLTNAGGRVDVVTRALTGHLAAHRDRAVSNANVTAVAALRTFAAPGQLHVTSWEGDRLGVHFKVVAADTDLAYVGSANLTGPGAVAHAELGVLLTGPDVTAVVAWVDAVAAAIRTAQTTGR